MALPEPDIGMVVHYAYLWSRHQERQAGEKDRPTVVLSVNEDDDGDLMVRVAPITHTKPDNPAEGILIPDETKKRLGLDDKPQWLMISEVNEFAWPGLDLRRVPDKFPKSYFYGQMPGKLLQEACSKMGCLDFNGKLKSVTRDFQSKLEM